MDFFNLISKEVFNVWRYANFYKEFVRPEFRLSGGEGWTTEESHQSLPDHLPPLYFKREDRNALGSFKIRGLSYQISRAWQNGEKKFCISSTGNAALAAAVLCRKTNLELFCFFHKNPKDKTKREKVLKEISNQKPSGIFFEEKPTEKCRAFAKANGIYNLTASSDPWSSEGFKSIGFELAEKKLLSQAAGKVGGVFCFSSSGSSIIGIGEGFRFLLQNGVIKTAIPLYPVKNVSIKRGVEVESLVQESNGEIININLNDLGKSQKLLSLLSVQTSVEGAAALAGFLKVQKVKKIEKPIIILSGRKWI
ncbi:MAG: PLP-dependent lyase/thiolase [Patescibacteria group bacterium]